MNVFEKDEKYIAKTYGRVPVNVVKGKGSIAWDSEGKKYIDLGSGIAVNSFGYCDEEWISAVNKQLNDFQHTSNYYYTGPCAELAEILCTRTGMKKVFFSNSGAEANECAIKAARKYASDHKGKDCYKIITLNNSFHGRTLTTLAATGQDYFHQHFLPLTEGFIYVDPDIEKFKNIIKKEKIAAIMVEMIRGEGGVIPLKKDFCDEMVKLAHENDVIIIVDEVQTGNGRTGALYSYMNYEFTPDIVTTAKGLAGGLPIGATLLGTKVEDIFTPGLNGSTFGGNPVSCAAAINIINRIDDNFLNEVRNKSDYIVDKLLMAEGVEEITGMGLMLGIKTIKPASEVLKICLERGVFVLTAKDKVRLLPALNIDFELLKEAVQVIADACKETE